MRPEGADPEAKCPVDHKTRALWLEAARKRSPQTPAHGVPAPPAPTPSIPQVPKPWFSLDEQTWQEPRLDSADAQQWFGGSIAWLPHYEAGKKLQAQRAGKERARRALEEGGLRPNEAWPSLWIPFQSQHLGALGRFSLDYQQWTHVPAVPSEVVSRNGVAAALQYQFMQFEQHAGPASNPLRACTTFGHDGAWLNRHRDRHPRRPAPPRSQQPRQSEPTLPTDREISTIPRAIPSSTDHPLNSAERAALPGAASHSSPANSESDTGHDEASGNWVYPSQSQFYSAMRRKGHEASPEDMSAIVPIHNAVNEKAWSEILKWEAGRGAGVGEGPKLVSFAGDSKKLTPRARWNVMVHGSQAPFDRHDWVVQRGNGERVEYVIDFYSGKGEGGLAGGKGGLSFYLDVRPKLNSWQGIKMRMADWVGL